MPVQVESTRRLLRITHMRPYLLFISGTISLNEPEQDVSIASGLFEPVCTFQKACACVYTCAIAGA